MTESLAMKPKQFLHRSDRPDPRLLDIRYDNFLRSARRPRWPALIARPGKPVSPDAAAPLDAQNVVRAGTNFTSRFKVIWVVQSRRQKYSAGLVGQIRFTTPAI